MSELKKPPHVRWKHGQWRWEPPKALRKEHVSIGLGTDEQKAFEQGAKINLRIGLEEKPTMRNAPLYPPAKYSLEYLDRSYQRSPRFQGLSDESKRRYRRLNKIPKLIIPDPNADFRLITQAGVEHYKLLLQESAPDSYEEPENYVRDGLDSLARLIRHGNGIVERFFDPTLGVKRPPQKPRKVYWEDDEIEAVCKAAIENGYPSVAIMVRWAVTSGQRRGDMLKARWSELDLVGDECIWRFTIKKTKVDHEVGIDVDVAGQLRLLRNEHAARTRNIVSLRRPKKEYNGHVILNDRTGKPFVPGTWGSVFVELKKKAGIERDLVFHDLRRTCVINLLEAKVTIDDICSVTGHKLKYAHEIIEIYRANRATASLAAIDAVRSMKSRKKRNLR